jgi:hypothetical protein
MNIWYMLNNNGTFHTCSWIKGNTLYCRYMGHVAECNVNGSYLYHAVIL